MWALKKDLFFYQKIYGIAFAIKIKIYINLPLSDDTT